MGALDGYVAVLFDLDGVITSTAKQHFAAWKEMFDDFLQSHAERQDVPFRPFEQSDYNRYVDGVPRYDGVRNFLAARGIEIPAGAPDDPPERDTIRGLG